MIFSIRALQLRTLNTFWSVVWVMVSWRASEQWFWLGTSLENQILMYTRSWPVNIHSSQCISSKLDEVWEGVLVCFHCLAQIGVHEVYFIITVCHHIFHTDLSWKLGMGFGFMLNTGVWIHVEYGVVNSHHTFAEMGRSEHAASIHPSSHRRQRPGTWTWVESQEHVEQMIHLAVYNIFLVKSSHFLMSEVLKLSWISWVAISRVSGPERGNLRSIKTKLVRLPPWWINPSWVVFLQIQELKARGSMNAITFSIGDTGLALGASNPCCAQSPGTASTRVLWNGAGTW